VLMRWQDIGYPYWSMTSRDTTRWLHRAKSFAVDTLLVAENRATRRPDHPGEQGDVLKAAVRLVQVPLSPRKSASSPGARRVPGRQAVLRGCWTRRRAIRSIVPAPVGSHVTL